MFKLLYLKLEEHPQLGNLEIKFVDDIEFSKTEQPYTSLIIGANGTGKSFILKIIADIFRAFKDFRDTQKKEFSFPFSFHLRYRFYHNTYEIITHRLIVHGRTGQRRTFLYFKNRPFDVSIFKEGSITETITGFEVIPGELELPERVIVSSIMLNDRFTFSDSKPEDFYQYLGVRRTPSTTSTKTFSQKTIKYLFDASKTGYFIRDLADLLHFLGFEKYFRVQYITRYNPLFFAGNIDKEEFNKFFERWWESKYTKRPKEHIPYSKSHYEHLKKVNPARLDQIIDYLNSIVKNERRILHKPKSTAKFLELDLFDEQQLELFVNNPDLFEFDLIEDLIKLDIISLKEIKIKKVGTQLSIDQVSSGEYHLIISMLGIYSKIKNSCLILVDEPEISLHPNWQMQYISFLKKMFSKYPECHFLLTTHSHFLISDLEGESSSVVSLKRDSENNIRAMLLEGIDPFGWSAEQVLLDVFEVPTTRNYYVAERLAQIFKQASKSRNPDLSEYREELMSWHKTLIKSDPLRYTIDQLIKRMGWQD